MVHSRNEETSINSMKIRKSRYDKKKKKKKKSDIGKPSK